MPHLRGDVFLAVGVFSLVFIALSSSFFILIDLSCYLSVFLRKIIFLKVLWVHGLLICYILYFTVFKWRKCWIANTCIDLIAAVMQLKLICFDILIAHDWKPQCCHPGKKLFESEGETETSETQNPTVLSKLYIWVF